jgi:VWFA-related protein
VTRFPAARQAGWRSLVAMAATALALAAVALKAQQTPRFTERVDVARVVVDARVLDDRGDPIPGLQADDFKVKIDGKTVRVETATWIGGRAAELDTPAPALAAPHIETVPVTNQGRLIVFLFQKDLEPSRIVGLMRMLLKSRRLLDTLTPNDRVAILSFDSRLRIWTDFTNDGERFDRILEHGILFERPASSVVSDEPSLVERLAPENVQHAYGIERALELIGDALKPLPGSKSLVLFGHGFGRFSSSGMSMENEYGPARRALVASRTSVFSLDVTDADYHSLEAGLRLVAEQTGGFYARTHIFPDLAMRELSGALAGYYVLFIEKPDAARTSHAIDVELSRRKGHVLAAEAYQG